MTLDSFRDWLMQEMPINKFQLMGKWGATDKNRGYNAQDIGILTNPKAVDKIHRQWNNSKNTFDFYFVRSPQAYKQRQVGKVTPEFVKEKLGVDIQHDPDSITVIFTNNMGAEKIPMTGWMMAHRFGHSIALSDRGQQGSSPFQKFSKEVEKDFTEIASILYGLKPPPSSGYYSQQIDLRPLAYAVGTMKSAENRNLVRFFEFVYELIAQYLVTGHVKFNDLPKRLIIKNKKAWGNPAPETTWARGGEPALVEWNETLHQNAEKYEYQLDEIFNSLDGQIFIM